MTEYTIGVFCFLAFLGMLSLLCYGSGAAEKTAVGIIAAFVILSPIVSAIKNIDLDSALDSLTGGGYEADSDPSLVAEEAFATGIKRAVAEKFSLKEEDVRVKIRDFDMEKMKSSQIIIFLGGAAAFADYRGIEEYINGLGMGECRVEVGLGK